MKTHRRILLALACVALVPLASSTFAQDKGAPAAKPVAASSQQPTEMDIRYQRMAYPLSKCVVSGDELGADAVDHMVDGRLVRLCCKDCIASVAEKKDKILQKIDAAVVEAQRADYPLERCPISGEKLAEKGGGVEHVSHMRLIRFCCKDCVAKFAADPGPTLDKLDKAYIATQKAAYPLDTCAVSGKKLGDMGEPLDYLYGTRLVRLCCGGCKKSIDKDPAAAFAKIDAARAEKAKAGGLQRKG